MARANTTTWLSLDRYAEIMGIHPLHFSGLYHPTLAQDTKCSSTWMQWDWQSGNKLSRESLARAIRDAELKISQQAGYNLLPDWVIDERCKTVRGAIADLYSAGHTIRGQRKSIHTKKVYICSGGIKATTLLADYNAAGSTFSYSDNDGDGFEETANATFSVPSGTLACEIRLFFSGHSANPEWEIKPVEITVSGTAATATFKKWQLVNPVVLDRLNLSGLDATTSTNFVSAPDSSRIPFQVYRVYNDPQTQLQMLWEDPNCGSCGGNGCTTCQLAVQAGCLTVRDTRLGSFSYGPGTWNSSTSSFDSACLSVGRDPDRLRLWYYAGWRDETMTCPQKQLDPALELAIAYLATALVAREFCNCNNVKAFAEYWREDLGMSNSQRSFQNGAVVTGNPWGTTRGAVYAWNVINEEVRLVGR